MAIIKKCSSPLANLHDASHWEAASSPWEAEVAQLFQGDTACTTSKFWSSVRHITLKYLIPSEIESKRPAAWFDEPEKELNVDGVNTGSATGTS